MTHPTWRAPLRALPGGRSTRAAPPAWARAEVRSLDTVELHLLRSALARALSELPLGSPGSAAIGRPLASGARGARPARASASSRAPRLSARPDNASRAHARAIFTEGRASMAIHRREASMAYDFPLPDTSGPGPSSTHSARWWSASPALRARVRTRAPARISEPPPAGSQTASSAAALESSAASRRLRARRSPRCSRATTHCSSCSTSAPATGRSRALAWAIHRLVRARVALEAAPGAQHVRALL